MFSWFGQRPLLVWHIINLLYLKFLNLKNLINKIKVLPSGHSAWFWVVRLSANADPGREFVPMQIFLDSLVVVSAEAWWQADSQALLKERVWEFFSCFTIWLNGKHLHYSFHIRSSLWLVHGEQSVTCFMASTCLIAA